MVKSQTIINLIEALAPKCLAEDWDNVGLQVGSPEAKVQKLIVCLDLTDEVLEQAIAQKAEMIVTHHPLIFKPLKKISFLTPLGARIAKLIQHNITVYSAHTNLDVAQGGINDILVEKLGLERAAVLAPTQEEKCGLGRVAYLPEQVKLADFVQMVKQALGVKDLRVVGDLDSTVQKIALCGGSGGSLVALAAFKGAQVLLTADIKYHEALDAKDLNLALIDAGHDFTEQVIVPILVDYLQKKLVEKVEIVGLELSSEPVFKTI